MLTTFGQQSALSIGSDINNSFGNISYSIGQIFFESNSMDTSIFNHGVQQPIASTNLNISDIEKIEIKVYPNPVSEQIFISLNRKESSNLSYILFNLHGMIILNRTISNDISIIPIDFLQPSSYFLYVFDGLDQIGTYRIIKI